MYDLTIGVFENLEITSPTDADKRLAYMQRILIRDALKKTTRGSGDMQTFDEGACG